MTFEQQYQQLNQQQKRVVDGLDQNILLLAAAGTGKTNTLALRIANILRQGLAEGNQILCLTFTNRACKEMKERISSMESAKDITVRTFHSFCFEVVRGYAKQSDISTDLMISDEDDCLDLLKELDLSAMGCDNLQPVQQFINHIKEQKMIFPTLNFQQIIQYCYQHDRMKLEQVCSIRGNLNQVQYRFLLKYGAGLVKRYNRLLEERHSVDFNDILAKGMEALSDETYCDRIKQQYHFIHIDEVQDTSLIEYQIVEKIFGNAKVMLCGDYFQTIYQWRGSKPRDIFGRFTKEYHPTRIVFDQNYRSTQLLLNASYDFLKTSFPQQVQDIYGEQMQAKAADPGNPILLHCADHPADEAAWIHQQIQQLGDVDLSRIAVLCRNNIHAYRLSEVLLKINLEGEKWIDFLLADQYKFFRTKEIKDILAFLRLAVNRYDDTSLARIMLGYVRGVGIKTLQKLESKDYRTLGIRLNDWLRPGIQTGNPYDPLQKALLNENVVVFDVESTGTDTSSDEIIQIAAVRIDAEGRVLEQFEQLLIPSKPVGSSEAVHHFSDSYLQKHGRDAKQVLQEFNQFLYGRVVVGHNVSYDLTILSSQLARLGLPQAGYIDDFDTLDLARRFYPELPNHKLETLSQLLDTQVKSSHDAMDDILATKDILIHLVTKKLPEFALQRQSIYLAYQPKFAKLAQMLQQLQKHAKTTPLQELVEQVIQSAHIEQLNNTQQQQNHIQEIRYLVRELSQPEKSCWDNIHALLEVSSLSATSLDRMLALKPRVPIITVHQAKGAEFDYVFLAGLQDDMFPSYFSQKEGNLAEERRTFYVAMTRAKKQLYFSCSLSIDGRPKKISRFIGEIPKKYLHVI